MSAKPSIPKGTRDFSPLQLSRRNFIFDTIRGIFEKYGFSPIETPSMENLSTLLGKYGDEGDRLIFKILNSGDYLSKADKTALIEQNSKSLTKSISEKALRYDLTVPFARYVVQHQGELAFPFKRYQIQPVWRADRPQKGRYREFYQCDADIIGSSSLLNELDLIQVISEVFIALKIETSIKLNNRKILAGIAEVIGQPDLMMEMTIALDKLDKIGLEKVIEEMHTKGLNPTSVSSLRNILENLSESKNANDRIETLRAILKNSEIGNKGIEELSFVLEQLNELGIANVELDYTLARGLNYYTGAIIEVTTNGFPGSLCGGGRYDDLTSVFGLKNMSGVGMSFGADRIYDVMADQNLFPESIEKRLEILFINFGEKEAKYCLPLLAKLRTNGISSELYPDAVKMKKQMKYANEKNVKKTILIGDNEIEADTMIVKDMESGEQKEMNLDELIKELV